MLQRLGIAEFLGLLIQQVGERTGITCEIDPDGVASPLYSVQLMQTRPANTKTMFIDCYEVHIHAISEPVKPYSPAKALELVQLLEEALTDELSLPQPFKVYRTEYMGLQALKKDPSSEGHAVLSFNFYICYGLRCK